MILRPKTQPTQVDHSETLYLLLFTNATSQVFGKMSLSPKRDRIHPTQIRSGFETVWPNLLRQLTNVILSKWNLKWEAPGNHNIQSQVIFPHFCNVGVDLRPPPSFWKKRGHRPPECLFKEWWIFPPWREELKTFSQKEREGKNEGILTLFLVPPSYWVKTWMDEEPNTLLFLNVYFIWDLRFRLKSLKKPSSLRLSET